VLADRGYFSSEEIKKCEQAGVTPLVPKPLTNNSAEGRFDKRDFHYTPATTSIAARPGRTRHLAVHSRERAGDPAYWSSPARNARSSDCTPSDYRRICAGSTRR
jgi:hypothetical protein